MICSAARSYCPNKPRYEDKKSAEDDKDRPLDKRYIPIWKASRKSIILQYVLYVWLKDKKFNWIFFLLFSLLKVSCQNLKLKDCKTVNKR